MILSGNANLGLHTRPTARKCKTIVAPDFGRRKAPGFPTITLISIFLHKLIQLNRAFHASIDPKQCQVAQLVETRVWVCVWFRGPGWRSRRYI